MHPIWPSGIHAHPVVHSRLSVLHASIDQIGIDLVGRVYDPEPAHRGSNVARIVHRGHIPDTPRRLPNPMHDEHNDEDCANRTENSYEEVGCAAGIEEQHSRNNWKTTRTATEKTDGREE